MDRAADPARIRVCDVHIAGRGAVDPARGHRRPCSPAGHRPAARRRGRHRHRGHRLPRRARSTCARAIASCCAPRRRCTAPRGRLSMGLGEGVTGWVARTGEPALIRDGALEDPRHRYFPELRRGALPVDGRGPVAGAQRRRGRRDRAPHRRAARVRRGGRSPSSAIPPRCSAAPSSTRSLYAEASARVHQLTTLTRASEALAAATESDAIAVAATAGGRAMLARTAVPAVPPRLRRPRAAAARLRPARRAGAAAPLAARSRSSCSTAPAAGARPAASGRGTTDAAVVVAPLVASGERLGVLCCLVDARGRRRRPTRTCCARSPTRRRWRSSAPS